jgi:hypothetical protein
MTSPLASLTSRQAQVVSLINLLGQITASQIRRSLYSDDHAGAVWSSRHLKRLTERGSIRRLPYKLSGALKGSGEYVYAPVDSKARIPNLHNLEVTELAVRLMNQPVRPMEFWPEPWSWNTWGGVALKPDAYIKLGRRHFFAEVDRETEWAAALSAQMNAYQRAYYGMDGGSFPLVVFTCHTPERKRFIQREIAKKSVSGLFQVCLFQDVLGVMAGASV